MTDDVDEANLNARSYTNLQVMEMLAEHSDFVEDVKSDMQYVHDSLIRLRRQHIVITILAFAAGYLVGRWMGLHG